MGMLPVDSSSLLCKTLNIFFLTVSQVKEIEELTLDDAIIDNSVINEIVTTLKALVRDLM